MAGFSFTSNKIIRPWPYLTQEICKQFCILPGTKLCADFTSKNEAAPHNEDHDWRNLGKSGVATSEEFLNVLDLTKYPSVASGFGVTLAPNQKVIKNEQGTGRSLITIEIVPASIEIIKDRYKLNSLKVNFCDASNQEFWHLPLTDLGFFRYAQELCAQNKLLELNSFIGNQRRVLLRIGLSRQYRAQDGREGYWIQVNGIYTFPEYPKEIRSYE